MFSTIVEKKSIINKENLIDKTIRYKEKSFVFFVFIIIFFLYLFTKIFINFRINYTIFYIHLLNISFLSKFINRFEMFLIIVEKKLIINKKSLINKTIRYKKKNFVFFVFIIISFFYSFIKIFINFRINHTIFYVYLFNILFLSKFINRFEIFLIIVEKKSIINKKGLINKTIRCKKEN